MLYRDLYNQTGESLCSIYEAGEAATIARYILEDLTGMQFWSEEIVSSEHLAVMDNAVHRLLQKEPWQYIGGVSDFYGMKFKVTSAVLIPRPETEELVFMALDLHKKLCLRTVMDVGTGSGVIAVTLAKKGHWDAVYALDISTEALGVAKMNAQEHGVTISFSQVDFLDESCWPTLPQSDLIVSNPPYILREEAVNMDENVVKYEPGQALFVSHHAMEFYDALSRFVVGFQRPGCRLMVEINERFGNEVMTVFQQNGLAQVLLFQDLQGKDRFVVGVLPN